MRDRAGVILIQHGAVALIERWRAGRHYYAFPGGGIELGESPRETAVREAWEELGLIVGLGRCVAEVQHAGDGPPAGVAHYFLAEIKGGTFGSGNGPEMTGGKPPERGTYKPVWMPLAELPGKLVYPRCIARLVARAVVGRERWPPDTLRLAEGTAEAPGTQHAAC